MWAGRDGCSLLSATRVCRELHVGSELAVPIPVRARVTCARPLPERVCGTCRGLAAALWAAQPGHAPSVPWQPAVPAGAFSARSAQPQLLRCRPPGRGEPALAADRSGPRAEKEPSVCCWSRRELFRACSACKPRDAKNRQSCEQGGLGTRVQLQAEVCPLQFPLKVAMGGRLYRRQAVAG